MRWQRRWEMRLLLEMLLERLLRRLLEMLVGRLLSSLDVTSWAWGCHTLTILYTTLGVTTVFEIRQLVDYLSLLQCWIYEHFPIICKRMVQYFPVRALWKGRQSHLGGVVEYRRRLDALTIDDII
ncbi:unnamed protein product [Lathyrus oleraceus]